MEKKVSCVYVFLRKALTKCDCLVDVIGVRYKACQMTFYCIFVFKNRYQGQFRRVKELGSKLSSQGRIITRSSFENHVVQDIDHLK